MNILRRGSGKSTLPSWERSPHSVGGIGVLQADHVRVALEVETFPGEGEMSTGTISIDAGMIRTTEMTKGDTGRIIVANPTHLYGTPGVAKKLWTTDTEAVEV
jgi:hypothetical protein